MWHKAILKGHPMRLELTRVGLLVELANHYTTRGAYDDNGSSHSSIITTRLFGKSTDFNINCLNSILTNYFNSIYHKEYSDYCLHLYCSIHIVFVDTFYASSYEYEKRCSVFTFLHEFKLGSNFVSSQFLATCS